MLKTCTFPRTVLKNLPCLYDFYGVYSCTISVSPGKGILYSVALFGCMLLGTFSLNVYNEEKVKKEEEIWHLEKEREMACTSLISKEKGGTYGAGEERKT